jgi:putative NADPH-quinone reductase
MAKILIINGHPDGDTARLCAALTDAYDRGAREAGHDVRRVDLAALDFPLITDRWAFETAEPTDDIKSLQASILWAGHLVIVHPLWLGGPPARLKGLLEQTFRYGFALGKPGGQGQAGGLLKGRSARLIVTMGMPAPVFRLVFGAFGVRAIERGILRLCGFSPVRHTLIGGVEGLTPVRAEFLFQQVAQLGRRGV